MRSVIVLLLLAGSLPQAYAEPAEAQAWDTLSKKQRAARTVKAKRYEKRGKKAYKKKLYEEAIVAFELAYEAMPQPRYLFNIGRCHEKVGDLFKAMEFTQRYVDGSAVGEERQDAEDMVDILRGRLKKTAGEVSIVTTPPGATVRVTRNDQIIQGPSPFERWLPTGEWALEVTLPEYETHTRIMSVALGLKSETTIELRSQAAGKAKAAKAAKAEAKAATQAASADAKAKVDAASKSIPPILSFTGI